MALVIDGSGDITGLTTGAIESAAIGSGAIRQVVNAAYSTYVSTTSTTLAATGITATITPTSSSSRILILVNIAGITGASSNGLHFELQRGGSLVAYIEDEAAYGAAGPLTSASATILDSPSSTSPLTYTVYWKRVGVGGNTIYFNNYNTSAGTTVSYITLIEVA